MSLSPPLVSLSASVWTNALASTSANEKMEMETPIRTLAEVKAKAGVDTLGDRLAE